MRKLAIIERAAQDPIAVRYGYNYNVKLLVNKYYCGSGRWCRTMQEAQEYAKEQGAEVLDLTNSD